MPQTRIVTLNYDPANSTVPFGPTPKQVRVKPNDKVEFHIGASTRASHQHCRLRITLHQDQHFSSGILQHAFGQNNNDALVLTVRPGLAAALTDLAAAQAPHPITAYKCELLTANGTAIPGLASDGVDGGEIVPDTN